MHAGSDSEGTYLRTPRLWRVTNAAITCRDTADTVREPTAGRSSRAFETLEHLPHRVPNAGLVYFGEAKWQSIHLSYLTIPYPRLD